MSDFQEKMSRNHQELFRAVTSKNSWTEYKQLSLSGQESTFSRNFNMVRSRTMLSVERLYDIQLSVQYLNKAGISGAFVEVGCWKGGSIAMMALSDETHTRTIWGFDTFAGHSPPPEDEYDIRGGNMRARYFEEIESFSSWASADYSDTIEFLGNLDLGKGRFIIKKGDVRETLMKCMNSLQSISFLRIDVDWYEESKTALQLLYPKLQSGGILTMDDYGHHSGQRRAVDEFFHDKAIKFTHVDYSCLTATKP